MWPVRAAAATIATGRRCETRPGAGYSHAESPLDDLAGFGAAVHEVYDELLRPSVHPLWWAGALTG
jgi:hypothetical protein